MDDLNQINGIQSVDYISHILELFCTDQAKFSLKDIAQRLDESPAKIYRYLVSLTRIGLLKKNESNEYEVGALALDLSFEALNHLDPVEEACKTAKVISSETNNGVAVSIWGALGPIVIKTFEPEQALYSQIRVGSVMSLVNSSIGNTFAQYLPEHILKKALDIEELRHAGLKLSVLDKKKFMTEIKIKHDELITLMVDRPSPGLSSISIPVFGISEEIQFVITLFNQTPAILKLDENFKNKIILKIKELSKNIGVN